MRQAGAPRLWPAALRGAAFLALWSILAGVALPGLVVGAVAAALATWVSLRLVPPSSRRPRPAALAAFALRLPVQALAAGVQVARLALDPRRRPEPAHLIWTPALPPGRARDAFLAYASLLPGTLPAGDTPEGAVVIHALAGADTAAAAMSAEEARFMRAFGLDA